MSTADWFVDREIRGRKAPMHLATALTEREARSLFAGLHSTMTWRHVLGRGDAVIESTDWLEATT